TQRDRRRSPARPCRVRVVGRGSDRATKPRNDEGRGQPKEPRPQRRGMDTRDGATSTPDPPPSSAPLCDPLCPPWFRGLLPPPLSPTLPRSLGAPACAG